MEDKKASESWVYVFVNGSAGQENFLGLYNKEKDVNFIPAFRTKEEANDCYLDIPREKGVKHELQAVHIEELYEIAVKNNFEVAIVDQDGKIVAD
ncbi:hypothetical protein [Desulfopila sp. IMCC35008]|uniref:hypothetical protein n=1 Tax=Desulfopila sp. IMCC35008 TaxID=2653858 RepID=UPI0013D775D7|nr:hypothetical protein [Desulfopila sp. IMCC35008]